ncbi:PITH domain-containing protein [Amylostereum chailletii]|nr:PITH domain-containing protein [Amylostereum chailletii]
MSESSDTSLLELLDLSQLNCLNEDSARTLRSICSSKSLNTSDSFLLSDADEQLLLSIPFNQTVRVRSIAIRSTSPEQAPKTIKLLVNRQSIGFEDVQDAEEPDVAQKLELTADQTREGRRIGLRFVRFQSVNSLHIFVESNQGGSDITRIDSIDVVGQPVESTKDLSGLKKQEDD